MGRRLDPQEAAVLTEGETAHGQALLQGRHPLRPVDQALLTRTMLGLLEEQETTGRRTTEGEP